MERIIPKNIIYYCSSIADNKNVLHFIPFLINDPRTIIHRHVVVSIDHISTLYTYIYILYIHNIAL